MLLLIYRERFWDNLTTPLFGTLTPPSDTTEVHCSEQSGADFYLQLTDK